MAIIDRRTPSPKRRSRKLISIFLVIVVVASLMAMTALLQTQVSDDAQAEPTSPARIAYTTHAPILIDGNAGFTGANASTGVTRGSGTVDDPYVIEGWEISSFPSRGIEITNANVHFTIRDCYVHHGTEIFSEAIRIGYCSNGIVRDCTCSDCSYGIGLLGSSGNSLVSNTCSDNHCGIELTNSNGNSLTDNVVSSSVYNEFGGGIRLYKSDSNCLANNTCSLYRSSCIKLEYSDGNTLIDNTCAGQGTWYGIDLFHSNSNNASGNTCSDNYYGMRISRSPDNRFFNNTCSDSVAYGFYTDWTYYDPGGGNRIWNNTFEDNNGAGSSYDPSHCQACDNGGGNWWNSSEGCGNYWSDWTTPDIAPQDGIVDAPYEIAGDAGAKDYHPLTTPGTQDHEPISPPAEVEVGVKAGDWIKLDYEISDAPSGTTLPTWIKVEFLDVEGTSVEVRVTMHMSDGTEESVTESVDVVGGGEALGLSGFVIPVNLTTGDTVYMTGYGDITLVGETTRKFAGASRTAVYASISEYGTEVTYYWDKLTGVLVEVRMSSGVMIGTAKASETNMWEAQSSGALVNSIVLYALVIAAIAIVVAVAFLMMRRKKEPSQTAAEAEEPPTAPPGT
ncbi:MAG: right-handed parallel beta-helix repeat-containing protein [Candidatus Thermoplasmatota archaeon]|nr:right-handed parallel beta-helix repeat-containing protein [Candidatus Thermoplasmatota archaeon]